jgi:hypothetical protein
VAVAMLALMGAGVVPKVCSWPVAGNIALGDTRHSRDVVRSVGQGGISNIMVMADDRHLGKQSRLFGSVTRPEGFALDTSWDCTSPGNEKRQTYPCPKASK